MFLIGGSKTRRVLLPAVVLAATLLVLIVTERGYVAWQLRIARTALAEAQVARALAALEAAEEVAPSHPEVVFLLGRAYRRDGQMERAVTYLERAGETGWSPEQLRHQRYLAVIQRGQFDVAQSYLDETLRRQNSDELAYEVYEAMAKGYLATYRLQDAMLCLDHFIRWRPEAVEPRLWRADIWTRLHRWENARAEYEKIVQRNPDCHAAWGRLGDCLLELNKVRQALHAYEQALAGEPDASAVLLGRAQCYLKLGASEKAASELQRLTARPLREELQAEVALGLAEVALAREDYEQALIHLHKAKDIDPGNAPIHYSLGKVLTRLQRPDEARREFALAERLRKQTSRFAEITQSLFDNPRDPDLRWEAGKILLDQGYKKTGAAWMATALAFDPHHRKTHESLAAYYAESNQPKRAAHHRRFLNDLDENEPDEFVPVDDE